MDISLIVKASNQQYEDQHVSCAETWTIRQLKRHLAEVHPGKPSTDEQKLIYSGKLLSDNTIIKDVLRQYEENQAHTLHLVFTSKYNTRTQQEPKATMSPSTTSGGEPAAAPAPGPSSSNTASTSAATGAKMHGSSPAAAAANTATDGLRQRHVGSPSASTSAGGPHIFPVGTAPVNPTPVLPLSAETILGQQLAFQNFLQQAYAQYVNQYMSWFSQNQGSIPSPFYPGVVPMNGVPRLTVPAAAATTAAALPRPQLLNPATSASLTMNANPAAVAPAATAGFTLPNLAYYPYLSSAALNASPMPPASSIAAPIGTSGTIPLTAAAGGPSAAASGTCSPSSPSPSQSSPAPPIIAGTSTGTSASSAAAATIGIGSGSQLPAAAVAATASRHGTQPTIGNAAAAATAVPTPAVSSVNQGRAANGEAATAPHQPADAQATAGAAAAAAAAPGDAAQQAQAAARRFPNIVVEEQENRDWLDIFFSMCRVGILMTVVYLYSSPTRFLTVFFVGFALYLYQIGFFRNLNQNNNNAERIERARQIVLQQINNAHGGGPAARVNPVLRARAAAQAAAGAAAEPAAARQPAPSASPVPRVVTDSAASADKPKPSSSLKPEIDSTATSTTATAPTTETSEAEKTPALASEATGNEEEQELVTASDVAPEANRLNINDVGAFLRTLVLSFFTSIIPDTPAA